MKNSFRHESGFTLVEIMVALVLSGIVAAGIYKAFSAQREVYVIQDGTVEMQQNLRAGMDLMVKEIRMAGYDPTGNAKATIVTATASTIHFTMDRNGNGNCTDTDEDITYLLDAGHNLVRQIPDVLHPPATISQPVAQNIQNLEFYYTLDKNIVPNQTTTPGDPTTIRAVQITMLARTSNQDKGYTDRNLYFTTHDAIPVKWGYPPYSDGYRRRLMSAFVTCRNMEWKP
jgi:type IV pilus assembly protein PilW